MLQQWLNTDLFAALRDKVNAAIALLNGGRLVQVGFIAPYMGNPNDGTLFDVNGTGIDGTAMEGYALCLGQALTDSLLVDFFGAPMANAPDLQAQFFVGWSTTDVDYIQIGQRGGVKKHLLSIGELPAHSHPDINEVYIGGSGWKGGNTGSGNTYDIHTAATGNTGGNLPHENRPPYVALGYIIRYK